VITSAIMKLFNRSSFQFASIAGRIGFPGHSLTLIAKGTFSLIHAGKAVISEEQLFPTGDELYSDDDEGLGSNRYASDFAYFKPQADLLLVGKCYTPGKKPLPACQTNFQVGENSKRLAVFGNRYWNPVSRTISDPEPFTEMELRYENSFGGSKDHRNPVGKGLSKLRHSNGQAVWALPNIEDINNLIDSPTSRPEPAGYAPLSIMWEQRYKKLGTYKGDWLQTRWPWYPLDFDWHHFNTAPSDLQVEGYLKGDEPLYFENLHPKYPTYGSRLPGIFPRMFINKRDEINPESFNFVEVPLNLDTLWVDMEAEKLVLVWRGIIDILSADYEELIHALIVSEDIHEAFRSKDYYHELLLHLLSGDKATELLETDLEPDELETPVEIEAEIKKAEVEVRNALIEAGIDPDQDLPRRSEADLENEVELLKSLGLEEARPEAPITREVIQQRVSMGEDLSEQDLRGIDLSGLKLSGGIFRNAILSGTNLKESILSGADFSGADLSKANLAFTDLSAAKLTDADLTGADLSNSKLTDAILDDAVLDNASFKKSLMGNISAKAASFFEADFSHAILSYGECQSADFSNAILFEADFQGANLTDANFEQATGVGINFANANLVGLRASGGTDFSKGAFKNISAQYSIWEEAILDGADFSYAVMEGSNLASASLKRAVFYGADFRYARLSKANLFQAKCVRMNLFQATLEKAYLEETDFSASNLYGVEFLDATVKHTKFRQTNLKMTKLLHFYEFV